MNAADRIAYVIRRARIDGGLDDEAVAHRVLKVLGLDEDGQPAETLGRERPTSSNLGHG